MLNKSYPTNIAEVQDTLTSNGWCLVDSDDDDCVLYEKELSVGTHNITCQTWSAVYDVAGTYSIQSIDVSYIKGSPYDVEDLMDMVCAIEMAETELVKFGIPFISRYQFHGEDRGSLAFYNENARSRIKDLAD